MSSAPHHQRDETEDELQATQTPGYRAPAQRDVNELASLDAEDESLNQWKKSLGIVPGATGTGGAKPEITLVALRLISDSLKAPVVLDLSSHEKRAALKKDGEVNIKEGSEYSVELEFSVSGGICSGLKYLQVAKRKGITVDKVEQMIGSYGPAPTTYVKRFPAEEAPSGMLARGSYTVRSRVVDDDKTIHADFEWAFKIAKEW